MSTHSATPGSPCCVVRAAQATACSPVSGAKSNVVPICNSAGLVAGVMTSTTSPAQRRISQACAQDPVLAKSWGSFASAAS
ncbi:nfx1-type zinc finger-containing protein 1 [Moniliophthora roreri]|nr:nfx1-type zinc finger-containing protein 1 [Moniliophthora roreri]